MSKTDKTKPSQVRLREVGAEEFGGYNGHTTFIPPRDFKWSYAERGIGRKHIKWAKRMKSKKNRRNEVPWTQMRGQGWGETNMDYWS